MKPTIYALSGFACTKKMYEPLKSLLNQANCEVVLEDNWGMGESKILGKKNYSLQELAEYHWQRIDELGIKDHLILLGTSMGGFLVQEMLLQRPKAAKAAIFLCTLGPKHNGFTTPAALTEAGLRAFFALTLEQRAFFGTEGTVHPSLKEKHPDRYQMILNYRMTNDSLIEEQIEQNNAAIKFIEGNVHYENIAHVPALVLHGQSDRFVSPSNAEILKSKFTRSQSVLIEDTDHFFFMEKPNEVAQEITNFIKKINA